MYIYKFFVEFAIKATLWRSARHGYQCCVRRGNHLFRAWDGVCAGFFRWVKQGVPVLDEKNDVDTLRPLVSVFLSRGPFL